MSVLPSTVNNVTFQAHQLEAPVSWLFSSRARLYELQQQERFCDVTIQADGENDGPILAHAAIVAGSSVVLEDCLRDEGEDATSWLLPVPGIGPWQWTQLISFMYTGKVMLKETGHAELLLEAAIKLRMEALVDLLKEDISSQAEKQRSEEEKVDAQISQPSQPSQPTTKTREQHTEEEEEEPVIVEIKTERCVIDLTVRGGKRKCSQQTYFESTESDDNSDREAFDYESLNEEPSQSPLKKESKTKKKKKKTESESEAEWTNIKQKRKKKEDESEEERKGKKQSKKKKKENESEKKERKKKKENESDEEWTEKKERKKKKKESLDKESPNKNQKNKVATQSTSNETEETATNQNTDLKKPKRRRKGEPKKLDKLKIKTISNDEEQPDNETEHSEMAEQKQSSKDRREEKGTYGIFRCEKCNKRYTYSKRFHRHKCQPRKIPPEQSGVYKCTEGEVIEIPHSPFLCEICQKLHQTLPTLIHHIRREHGADKIHEGAPQHRMTTMIPCPVCPRKDQRVRMPEHLWRDHGLRASTSNTFYKCPECGLRTKNVIRHKDHLNTHAGLALFMCDECGQRLSTRKGLNQHMLIHSGDKPFVCQFCPQMFSRKKYLTNHESLHTGHKAYTCNLCGKSFIQASSINFHFRKHHPEIAKEHRVKYRTFKKYAGGASGDGTPIQDIPVRNRAKKTTVSTRNMSFLGTDAATHYTMAYKHYTMEPSTAESDNNANPTNLPQPVTSSFGTALNLSQQALQLATHNAMLPEKSTAEETVHSSDSTAIPYPVEPLHQFPPTSMQFYYPC